VDGYADYTGVEASVLRGQDQREAVRQQRAQQQQQMRQVQEGMAAVEAMKKLGMTADKMPPGADQAAQPAG
jgi:maleate cis-trans isomerase